MKTQLFPHEWLAIASILFLIAVFVALSRHDDTVIPASIAHPHKVGRQSITVTIRGAVHHPGEYELPIGSLVSDLLKLAEPLPSANLKRVNIQSKLRNGRDIWIEEYSLITIHVKGAVAQPGPVTIRKGTTIEQLLQSIQLNADADVAALPLGKRLQRQQQLVVPVAKNPTNR